MKIRIPVLIAFFMVSVFVFAQKEEEAREFATTITVEDLHNHLSIIASDALEGRETGERGQKMAAAYIKAHFEKLGLTGPVASDYGDGYYQKVPLYTSRAGNSIIKAGDKEFLNFKEIIYLGNRISGGDKSSEVVFVGKGTEDELAGMDLKGKTLLVYTEDGIRSTIRKVSTLAKERGAIAVVLTLKEDKNTWQTSIKAYQRYLNGGRLSINNPAESEDLFSFAVTNEVASLLMNTSFEKLQKSVTDFKSGKKNALKKVDSGKFTFNTKQEVTIVNSENVLGFLEGTDKKDELVIITAHYDHVGRDGKEIYNGADDDGSGTVSVLEIAEAFVKAREAGKGPRRSILFMTVTGEEKGLLGSDYYTRNPVFPLESTVVDLNIDMVGRIDPEHKGKGDYVYLVGSNRLSTELHEISEKVNSTFTNLDLDYTYNDENHADRIYYRSDHWNFAKKKIPIIFYFNGVHEDYHKPTDTVDKIEFEALKKRAELVFFTAWVLANKEDRIVADKVEGTSIEIK
ncbi:MAG: M28 family peptidase [Cyclobacteriaceae bacterium]|nr:M28 family peptidase [Cyclobacteriaceae bacterium]